MMVQWCTLARGTMSHVFSYHSQSSHHARSLSCPRPFQHPHPHPHPHPHSHLHPPHPTSLQRRARLTHKCFQVLDLERRLVLADKSLRWLRVEQAAVRAEIEHVTIMAENLERGLLLLSARRVKDHVGVSVGGWESVRVCVGVGVWGCVGV